MRVLINSHTIIDGIEDLQADISNRGSVLIKAESLLMANIMEEKLVHNRISYKRFGKEIGCQFKVWCTSISAYQ
nr:MAG TPA: hypothetical protein [Crassvirales sp.]